MSKTEESEAAAIVTKARLPEVPEGTIVAIDEFLRHFLNRIELSCNDHRVIAMHDRTDRLAGIILYQRHQVATLKTLIAANLARGKRESSTRPGRRRNPDR